MPMLPNSIEFSIRRRISRRIDAHASRKCNHLQSHRDRHANNGWPERGVQEGDNHPKECDAVAARPEDDISGGIGSYRQRAGLLPRFVEDEPADKKGDGNGREAHREADGNEKRLRLRGNGSVGNENSDNEDEEGAFPNEKGSPDDTENRESYG